MGTVRDFEDLAIFQKARELSKRVYDITKKEDFKRDFRFVAQIHASAGSIMDNIAEGFQGTGTCPNLKNQRFAYLFPHPVSSWEGL